MRQLLPLPPIRADVRLTKDASSASALAATTDVMIAVSMAVRAMRRDKPQENALPATARPAMPHNPLKGTTSPRTEDSPPDPWRRDAFRWA